MPVSPLPRINPLIADKILAKKQREAWIAGASDPVRYRTAAPEMADRRAF
jgi:hypothetical protein